MACLRLRSCKVYRRGSRGIAPVCCCPLFGVTGREVRSPRCQRRHLAKVHPPCLAREARGKYKLPTPWT